MEKHYVGCSGFSERLWKGFFYPEDLQTKDYLKYYSERLNAVEINSTFYRKPTAKTLENWRSATPDGFKFFIKIPKSVTHLKKLNETSGDTADFCAHIADGLGDKLAGFLFQLPPSFQNKEENLEKLLNTVDSRYLNVVEFRHKSWWAEPVFKELEENQIIFSGVSFPKDIPDDVVENSRKTLYYRLHGVLVLFKSEYPEDFLKTLAAKVGKFKGTSYVFFNNTFGTAGIKNALEFQKFLD